MRPSSILILTALAAAGCSSGTSATSGGTANGGTSSSGGSTGGACPGLDIANELTPCDGGSSSCARGLGCADDPTFGLLCEYDCKSTANCPDLGTVCSNGHCIVNICGIGANGRYDGKCSGAGTDDGICVPIDASGDGGAAAYGICLQGGSAASNCNDQTRCGNPDLCQPGWFCSASAPGSATGTCLQLCTPGSALGACPTGSTCQADSQDLGTCVASQVPCNGIPVSGQCLSNSQVQFCAVATGSAMPAVKTYDCPGGTACVAADGGAQCELTGACVDGAVQCATSTQLETCVAGAWQVSQCPSGCIASAVGSACAPTLALTPISLTVQYELRGTNSSTAPTGWSTALSDAPAQSFLVLSYAGSPQQLVDAQVTDSVGAVTINVPANPSAADYVALVAAALSSSNGQLTVQYAVANPQFPSAGQQSVASEAPNPVIWSWSAASAGLTTGTTLTITEASGSGAARIFDNVRYAHDYAQSKEGSAGQTVVAWLGFGTSWDCGSCFAAAPVSFGGLSFQGQVWYGGNLSDQKWWADPVTVHEQGHWTMKSYGSPPGEGGPHVIGVPGFPGLAWSEGFATWFSSDLRNNSMYYDMQNGTFFWLDIGTHTYDQGSVGNPPWYLPSPSAGVIQFLDENQVSAMLWSLSNSASGADAQLFTALASKHMTTSPWPEGYTRYSFELSLSSCDPSAPASCYANVVNTGVPAPCLADFLDALDCAGSFSASTIDAATVPATEYPYPSGAPLCP